ncbi:hypothetical protein ACCAA_580013 [Candidatus Accumulibacter aalborgensis]|uniref:Uncharacterized protein n=1 Tax=Candidatus Accumulibacter aalborgensis TaxID=1860102 RepID=A0A1A8XTY4_9PROT|nr:hypothetical protein ACCAA_580013 [Candidatus Accumulibacter aalborgensis]
MTREPFDTPATRAAQGERKLTRWVSQKIPFLLSLSKHERDFPPPTEVFRFNEAWRDALARGHGWKTRALQGKTALLSLAPDLDDKMLWIND